MESHDEPAAQATPAAEPNRVELRLATIQERVFEAAGALIEQGLRPTVMRIRAALGGGSPNEIAPALRQWRRVGLSTAPDPMLPRLPDAPLPAPVADLARELWRRALSGAVLQLKTGTATTRQLISRSEEARALRQQLNLVREQLERESIAFGELRAQAARHEEIAKQALARAATAESRERTLLRDLGTKAAQIAQLEARLVQSRPRPAINTSGAKKTPRPRSTTSIKGRLHKNKAASKRTPAASRVRYRKRR